MASDDESASGGRDNEQVGRGAANEAARPSVEILGSPAAPFVYFDAAPAYSVEAGTAIIELVAVTYIPEREGRSRPEVVVTGHLRTSVAGMRSLRKAIDELELLIAPAANADGPKN